MRLFIAVNLPKSARERIWEIAAPLRERRYAVRWVAPEAIHITLKFLGEVSTHRETSVGAALKEATVGLNQFIMPIGGFGAFPDPRRAKVIWIGCKPPEPLKRLHGQLEDTFSEIGFPRETRSFHPHLTLGRLRRGAESSKLSGLEGVLDRLHFADELLVQSIELMQSELSPAGATYTIRKTIELSE